MPTLRVSLDTSTSPWSVLVDASGGANVIPKNAQPQPIHWHLTGNASGGEFLTQAGGKKGFEWRDPQPPPGIFGDPTLSPKRKALTIVDHHTDKTTKGTWAYSVGIKVAGTTYMVSMTNSPTIKNN